VTGKPRLLPPTAALVVVVAGKERETGLAKAELHVVYKVNIVVDLTYIHGGLSYDGVRPENGCRIPKGQTIWAMYSGSI
jgi:hypothetical protein